MEKKNNKPISLPYDSPGRPQIIVIGNGLERMDDGGDSTPESLRDTGKSWDDLVGALTIVDHIELQKDDLKSVPFPLKYHLLSSSRYADYPLKAENRIGEQEKLAKAVRELHMVTNPILRRLPDICADHIFTTNYTYSLERAFYPKKTEFDSRTRSNIRFNYNMEVTEEGNQRLERCYRLYTGYLGKNMDGSQVNLWHIHGECAVPGSIILGHDGFGRLLSRIVHVCSDRYKYRTLKNNKSYAFTSWPELFLFGDVYIIGFGFDISEFDLWWLLRRKQREEKGSGRVYFYTNDDGRRSRDRDLMLTALSVIINPGVFERGIEHSLFYTQAINDIKERIAVNRKHRL